MGWKRKKMKMKELSHYKVIEWEFIHLVFGIIKRKKVRVKVSEWMND